MAVATADRKEYTKKEKGCVGNSTQPLFIIVNTSLLALHLCNSPFLGPAEPAKPLCGPRQLLSMQSICIRCLLDSGCSNSRSHRGACPFRLPRSVRSNSRFRRDACPFRLPYHQLLSWRSQLPEQRPLCPWRLSVSVRFCSIAKNSSLCPQAGIR